MKEENMKCLGCGIEVATLDGGEVWLCYNVKCKFYGKEMPKPKNI